MGTCEDKQISDMRVKRQTRRMEDLIKSLRAVSTAHQKNSIDIKFSYIYLRSPRLQNTKIRASRIPDWREY
jgi:hypothetical protein